MKTVLVPVDYSPCSNNALLYALRMAQKSKLKVIVFHAFHPIVTPAAAYEIPTFIPELEKEKRDELEQYVKEITDTFPIEMILKFRSVEGTGERQGEEEKVFHSKSVEKPLRERYSASITSIARMGTVHEQILQAAQANGADLIVMGMLGGGGVVSQVLVGSTTVSVMRKSKVPVLGIPLRAKFRGLKSVVFASDLTNQPDKLLLQKLRDFVKTFRSRLAVLHLHRQKNQRLECSIVERALGALDQQLPDINFKVVLKQSEDLAEGIQEYLQTQGADLLILSPHRHNLCGKLLNESITARFVSYGALPLLTLPDSKKEKQEKLQEEIEKLQDF